VSEIEREREAKKKRRTTHARTKKKNPIRSKIAFNVRWSPKSRGGNAITRAVARTTSIQKEEEEEEEEEV